MNKKFSVLKHVLSFDSVMGYFVISLLVLFIFKDAFAFKERIMGGEPVDIKDRPFQLTIRTNDDRHSGGASIISSVWAVTAAHCVASPGADEYSVRAGTDQRDGGGTLHKIIEIVIHPDYNKIAIDYDIAVFKVRTPFALGSEGINRIALASDLPKPGVMASASGWGYTENGGTEILRMVEVPIVEHALCQKSYEQYLNVTDRMLCAGYKDGGKDACSGDSGGPLVVNSELVGIVSWGNECGLPDFPGVYASVAYFRQWIKDNTGV